MAVQVKSIRYEHDPRDFEPWELGLGFWARAKVRKPCFCCNEWINWGRLFVVVTHQAVCQACYRVAVMLS